MRAPSKDVNNGNSSASAQHQSSTNSSSLTVRTESNGPAAGSTKSSSLPRSSASDSKPKRPVPRLQVSAPSSDSGTGSTLPELETILKEMKKVPPVLTAIETPRKEECRPHFPTTPVQDPVPNHLDENGDSKHLLDSRKVASPPRPNIRYTATVIEGLREKFRAAAGLYIISSRRDRGVARRFFREREDGNKQKKFAFPKSLLSSAERTNAFLEIARGHRSRLEPRAEEVARSETRRLWPTTTSLVRVCIS
ncbi:hypothetical protein MRX96_022741 [Rhipicephalus microplus]